ncbi:MAG: metal ABC transporter permease [Bacilli bacterium]|nr:metal ABC transporter permease [Bacilli bacterium]
MLRYDFMVVAFIVAILLGIALPLIGSGVVYKRLSSSGDALAHSSLAGVAIGLVSGLNPLLISILTCIVSFLIIELLRKKFEKFSEVGVVVVLSCAIGIAGILSNYVKNANFSSYLFGSITLVSNLEFIITIVITAVVILFSILFYGPFFSCLYSENEAKVRGTKVGLINFIHSLLLSITVAVGAKVVGSLVVSSMIVLPTAIAMQFKKGYFWTLLISVFTGIICMVGGFIISYEASWPAGATIVLTTVAVLILVFIVKGILLLINSKRKSA